MFAFLNDAPPVQLVPDPPCSVGGRGSSTLRRGCRAGSLSSTLAWSSFFIHCFWQMSRISIRNFLQNE